MAVKSMICGVLALSCLILNVSSMLSNNPALNTESLRKIFESVKPYSDLSSAFYSIQGNSLLGEPALDATNSKEVCEFVKAKVDKNSIESIYQATALAALIQNCPLDTSAFQAVLANGDASTSVSDLYYYALTMKTLNQKLNSAKLSKSLTEALKSDSSILNQGFSLHIAALLDENNKVFYESIDDVLDQADEVDKKFLQYEGGVGTTAIVLEGILSLSERFNKLSAKLDQKTLTKFVNYLSSKRFPTNIKSAYFLLKGAVKLTDNKLAVPIILNRLSPIGISSSQSNLVVSVTDLLGRSVKNAQVNINAASAASSTAKTLFSGKKLSFTPKSSDRSTFQVALIEQNQQVVPEFYMVTVELNLKPEEKHFFLTQNKVEIKVTTVVEVTDVSLGVSDRDASNPTLNKYENKPLTLSADQMTKFSVKFSLKSKNSLIEAHQTFVKFTETKTGREIIYLAEAGLSKQYLAEIDFSQHAKNFNYQSGVYSVDLIVSDSLFENPVALKLSQLNVKFSEENLSTADKSALYSKKAEIKHLFREADPRPPVFFSTVFALLCLAPLALLVILWFSIGFNLSKFSFSLSALVFHASLAGIFLLFYCYWIKLNMFQTLRYLSFIGFVAIVSGSKLLKSLVAKKEKKN